MACTPKTNRRINRERVISFFTYFFLIFSQSSRDQHGPILRLPVLHPFIASDAHPYISRTRPPLIVFSIVSETWGSKTLCCNEHGCNSSPNTRTATLTLCYVAASALIVFAGLHHWNGPIRGASQHAATHTRRIIVNN